MLISMGTMHRAEAREAEAEAEAAHLRDRFASTLIIAAAIIAAVRLAREPNLTRSTPRIAAAVGDSVALARSILNRVMGSM